MADQNPIPQTIRQALAKLDGIFTAAKAAREQAARTYGYGADGRVPSLVLDNLMKTYRPQVAIAARTIQDAIDQAQKDAVAAVNAARKADAESPDGQRYLVAVPAYAALIQDMDPDQVAARLEQVLDADLKADARAVMELARQRFPVMGLHLAAQVRRAEQATLAPELVQALNAQTALEDIAWRYGLAKAKFQDKLAGIVELGMDPDSVGYRSAWVIGDTKAANSRFAVR